MPQFIVSWEYEAIIDVEGNPDPAKLDKALRRAIADDIDLSSGIGIEVEAEIIETDGQYEAHYAIRVDDSYRGYEVVDDEITREGRALVEGGLF